MSCAQLTNNHITESETRKKSLENSRHFLWLLINLIEFQESETLPTVGPNYNTTPQQPSPGASSMRNLLQPLA